MRVSTCAPGSCAQSVQLPLQRLLSAGRSEIPLLLKMWQTLLLCLPGADRAHCSLVLAEDEAALSRHLAVSRRVLDCEPWKELCPAPRMSLFF